MKKTVVVYGGGMAGLRVAQALKKDVQVTLVSPLDYFEVPMALPRNLVEPEFTQRSVIPFATFLEGINHIQGHLIDFDGEVGTVEALNGKTLELTADLSVLATGSRYANPLTRAQYGNAQERRASFLKFNQQLIQAKRILIVGAGPIGVEFAGEIVQEYSDKVVTIVESNSDILMGTSRKAAQHARQVLEKKGVKFLLNERVTTPTYGEMPEGGIAYTQQGTEVPFDLIFWAVGSQPNTAFMPQQYINEKGYIHVDQYLRVKDLPSVFVLGDITNLDEVKKAIYVNTHVKVAIKNIKSVLKDRLPKATYKAQTSNDIMLVTLGRKGGVLQIPKLGMIKAAWFIRMAKARDMLVGMYRKAVNAPVKA